MKFNFKVTLAATVVLFALTSFTGALCEPTDTAKDITSLCMVMPSEGDVTLLLDGDERTAWTYEKPGAQIEIQLPAGTPTGGLYLSWLEVPTALDIIEYDGVGKELARGNRETIYKYYYNYYLFEVETVQVVIRLAEVGAPLAQLRVFGPGELPPTVMHWTPLEKADLMLIAVHPGDELRYFGGALPYYARVRGKTVQPVYITGSGEQGRTALTALWELGIRHYPSFLGLADGNPSTMAEMEDLWVKTRALSSLVTNIRKYKPDVVITHDPQGEEGDISHQLAAITAREAVLQAPVSRKFGGSYSEFGAWQVKKMYLHRLETAPITMNWQIPSEALGGKTPGEVASRLYALYQSPAHSGGYQGDNTRFGLAMTALSADTERNDVFENVPGNVPDPALSTSSDEDNDEDGDHESPAITPEGIPPADTKADADASQDFVADESINTSSDQKHEPTHDTAVSARTDDPRRGKFTLMLFGIPTALALLTFCGLWVRARILLARRRRELRRRAGKQRRISEYTTRPHRGGPVPTKRGKDK